MAVRVQHDDFDVSAETEKLIGGRTDIGAIVTFTGRVRGADSERQIDALTLEHYPDMTEAEMARIEAEAHARWPLQASLLIHRVGVLHAGDNIVLVIAASTHRQAAFEAAAFLMDFLKTRAPFWKKETMPSGETKWVDARAEDDGAADRWR